MAFRKERSFTDGKGNFYNEMARFASEEAAFFSGTENEAASANIDAMAERAIRASKNKNVTQINSIKAQIKEMKKEEKLWKKENEKSSEKRNDNESIYRNKKKKELNAEKKKQTKKQAAKTAIGNFLRKKGAFSNELAGKETSGDAFRDGREGLVGTVLEAINPMHYLKMFLAKIAALLAPAILIFMTIAIILVVIVALLFDVLQPIVEVKNAIDSFVSFFTGGSDDEEDEEEEPEPVFIKEALTQDEIDEIISESGCDDNTEEVIRFALEKVGSPYSQANRTDGTSFDCSSLAYYAWGNADMDIGFGNNGPPCAAEEARLLYENGKEVSVSNPFDFRLEPGDLIFYGGSDNGRYKGIYHVAIYVGNLKCVEALNEMYGVVYRDMDYDDAIMICRPGQ